MVHDRPFNCVYNMPHYGWVLSLPTTLCVLIQTKARKGPCTVCFQCVCMCVCLTIRETVLAYACAWVYRRECNNCLRLIPKCDELSVRVKIFLHATILPLLHSCVCALSSHSVFAVLLCVPSSYPSDLHQSTA